jgi:hypothetical protein
VDGLAGDAVMPSNDKPSSSDWYESSFPVSPSQGAASLDPATGRGGQSLWMIPIVLWIVALCIPLALVLIFVIAAVIVGFSNRNAFNLFQGLDQLAKDFQSGGTAAHDAAVAFGPQVASLSPSVLAARLPQYQWVDGATNAPYSSAKRYIVGVNASGTHVVTAVKADPDFCSYGLSVTSGADPLVTEDHLPGPGTYFQMVWQAPQCAADQAPTSGWQAWQLPQ